MTSIVVLPLIHLMTQKEPDLHKEPYPVLALLDEFGNMARINKLKEGMSFLRSYRVCSIVIVQYVSQIISVYGQHDAKGFTNAKIKIAFAMSDLDDAKFFSEALGKTAVKVHSSTSTTGKQESNSKNISYQTRPLLAPDELMRLKKDEAIIVVEAASPIRAKKYDVYKDKRYRSIVRNLAASDKG
ncbi:MAG: type IV secretory system conjugative DNA transfer family protein [Coxiellaceae bacterium]|nr:type IV secretory system conjugative DNA transfer family protein [Coxiellaceae bacterium]